MNRLLLVFVFLFGCGGYVTQADMDHYTTKNELYEVYEAVLDSSYKCHALYRMYMDARNVCYGCRSGRGLTVEQACELRELWLYKCRHTELLP